MENIKSNLVQLSKRGKNFIKTNLVQLSKKGKNTKTSFTTSVIDWKNENVNFFSQVKSIKKDIENKKFKY